MALYWFLAIVTMALSYAGAFLVGSFIPAKWDTARFLIGGTGGLATAMACFYVFGMLLI